MHKVNAHNDQAAGINRRIWNIGQDAVVTAGTMDKQKDIEILIKITAKIFLINRHFFYTIWSVRSQLTYVKHIGGDI